MNQHGGSALASIAESSLGGCRIRSSVNGGWADYVNPSQTDLSDNHPGMLAARNPGSMLGCADELGKPGTQLHRLWIATRRVESGSGL